MFQITTTFFLTATFDVQKSSSIEYVFTLQGYPAYKFSLEIIAIPCNTVTKLTCKYLKKIVGCQKLDKKEE